MAAHDLVLPAYGHSTLADLLPAIGSHLGLPGPDPLRLPDANRWVVLVVDGLGARQLTAHAAHATFLSGFAGELTAGVPSTTVTSLTSLGTALPPGRHGMVGYTWRDPRGGELVNLLHWPGDADVSGLGVPPTYLARMAAAGIAVGAVTVGQFVGSPLTRVALSGPVCYSFPDETDEDRRTAETIRAATAGERTVVYAYERELDHTGHERGVDSAAWRAHLRRIDAMAERLRDELPDDVRLVVTGDHGMVDVPPDHMVVVEDTPALSRGVRMVAGEGRFRHAWAEPGLIDEVVDRWRTELADRAVVLTRAEAVAAGWYGPVGATVLGRYGDLVAAALDDWAVITSTMPGEAHLVGMHGSLTAAEMCVPLVVA